MTSLIPPNAAIDANPASACSPCNSTMLAPCSESELSPPGLFPFVKETNHQILPRLMLATKPPSPNAKAERSKRPGF